MERHVSLLLDQLSKRPDVLGVAIFGSVARGDARSDSDVDVFVLVREGSWRDVETHADKNFELVYSSAQNSRAFWTAHPDEFVKMWAEAKILLDGEGELEEFRNEAEAGAFTEKTRAAADVIELLFSRGA